MTERLYALMEMTGKELDAWASDPEMDSDTIEEMLAAIELEKRARGY